MGRPGAGEGGRGAPGRLRAESGRDVAQRAGRVGDRLGRPGGVQGVIRRHDLHTGLHLRGAAEHLGFAGGSGHGGQRGGRRRDRRLRHEPAVVGRHRRRSTVQPGAHPAQQHHRGGVGRRRDDRPADVAGTGAAAADAQTGSLRTRPVLPGQGPHGLRPQTQRGAGGARLPELDRRGAGRHRAHALRCRRPAALRGDHHRPPLGRTAAERHLADPGQVDHLDAAAERHHGPARHALHGRGRGLPATDGQSAHEEAHHAADEAGAGVRPRRGAVHPESGGCRLQGIEQCRHLAGRAVEHGSGQGTPARWHGQFRRRRRCRRGERCHLRPREAAVPAAQGGQE